MMGMFRRFTQRRLTACSPSMACNRLRAETRESSNRGRTRGCGKLDTASPSLRRGFSSLETLIATAMVGILMVAALQTSGQSLLRQNATVDQAKGIWLADSLMAEIRCRTYSDPDVTTISLGTDIGESAQDKRTFDDVDDFHLWTESPCLDPFAQPLDLPQSWTREASVQWIERSPSGEWIESSHETGFKRIVVEVRRSGVVMARHTSLIARP